MKEKLHAAKKDFIKKSVAKLHKRRLSDHSIEVAELRKMVKRQKRIISILMAELKGK